MEEQNFLSPFSTRYASKEMQYIFSEEYKFKTWRKLWVLLAKAEKKHGLNITDEQIAELEANAENLNLDVAKEREKLVRHDVMSHIYAYGTQCEKAAGIIHLGATSCFVTDNTEVLQMKDGLLIILKKLISVMSLLKDFSLEHKSLPALAYTHLQPAQLTTVGKRASLWLHDFYIDYLEIKRQIENLKLLGSKGATGTQASFMELFDKDCDKVLAVEKEIANKLELEVVPVSGQTYTRKYDFYILSALAGIAQSASKFSCDIRLLQNFKEIEEPFETKQIGSSAMPYKRNPMRSERITSLARYAIINVLNPAFTAGTQWFERTLDDSANRRISIAEGFLAIDSILNIMVNVCNGLVVYPNVINKRIMQELPFMATENIMMAATLKGGNRQVLHEKIREHSLAAAKRVKEFGQSNDLIERICNDKDFGLDYDEIAKLLKPELYIGLSPRQVEKFINECITPILNENADKVNVGIELDV